MAYEIILPKLGQTVEESRLVEWLKAEGDTVDRGDVLFTVETDKAVLDVEATRKGYLRKILVPGGETVPVLTVVGLITRTADESLEEAAPPADAAASPTAGEVATGCAGCYGGAYARRGGGANRARVLIASRSKGGA